MTEKRNPFPPKSIQISKKQGRDMRLTLPLEDLAAIDAKVKEDGFRFRSDWIRHLIDLRVHDRLIPFDAAHKEVIKWFGEMAGSAAGRLMWAEEQHYMEQMKDREGGGL